MIVLHPVLDKDGKRIPGLFEDLETGGNEPTFVEQSHNGQIIYSHESGYGYVSRDRVCIMEHV